MTKFSDMFAGIAMAKTRVLALVLILALQFELH